jgi:hypothetical protein
MGGKVSDTNGYPQEPDRRKCTLMPVDDRSGTILTMLFNHGGALGPEDGDRLSGLRYFRLPKGWTLERTDRSYHDWCRLGPVDLVALTGTYLILDDQGRQRAKVHYYRQPLPASSYGFLVRAQRYTFRTSLSQRDRMVIEVMDGVTPIYRSEQIPVLNGRPDSRIYKIKWEQMEIWLHSHIGDYSNVTAEYYD